MRLSLFSGGFWGIYLIIMGFLALMKSYANLDIPLFRAGIGILLIMIGLTLMLGGGVAWETEPDTVLMQQRTVTLNHSGSFRTLFGESTFHVEPPAEATSLDLEFDTVFASSTIHLPKDVAVKIDISTAFGQTQLPDGSSWSFGGGTYTSPGYDEATERIHLRGSTVFGSLTIRQ